MKQSKGLIVGIVVAAVVIVAGLLVLSGHSKKSSNSNSSSSSSSASTSAKADTSNAVATNAVSIENYMFTPMVVKVKVGDTITWTNKDGVHHNVVADNPSSDAPNGPLIGQGETYDFKFTKAGTYTFHCMPHPYMHGTVVVTE